MEQRTFYSDIKESIEKYFSFLTAYGFSDFEENQVAYECHFETKNNFVSIDIWFEATSSTPIWAKIDRYYIDNLEPENQLLKDYSSQLKANYDQLFEQYLNTNKRKYLEEITKQYAVNGKEINDSYLIELSEILQRHDYVLRGDLDLLQSNAAIAAKERALKIAAERIKNGIYTLEYQFISEDVNPDEYDAYEEFKDIKAIKKYLAERSEIKIYRVLDCYMNEIKLEG
ncbi:MAG TPA: hypothetical protein VF008_11390 [Niastella sp.]